MLCFWAFRPGGCAYLAVIPVNLHPCDWHSLPMGTVTKSYGRCQECQSAHFARSTIALPGSTRGSCRGDGDTGRAHTYCRQKQNHTRDLHNAKLRELGDLLAIQDQASAPGALIAYFSEKVTSASGPVTRTGHGYIDKRGQFVWRTE